MKILEYPHPALRQKAEEVTSFDDSLKSTLDEMLEAMYEAKGIGLAGPQVNILKRITVIDLGEGEGPLKLVNPVISNASGSVTIEEGCLSIPELRAKVTRPDKISVTAQDENGQKISFVAEELLAVCIQHEVDHLNGVLFTDRVSGMKKQMVQNQLKKLK